MAKNILNQRGSSFGDHMVINFQIESVMASTTSPVYIFKLGKAWKVGEITEMGINSDSTAGTISIYEAEAATGEYLAGQIDYADNTAAVRDVGGGYAANDQGELFLTVEEASAIATGVTSIRLAIKRRGF